MRVIRTGPDGEPREVEFTDIEMRVKDEFDELLDQGQGIPQAAAFALSKIGGQVGRGWTLLSTPFVKWLSDDTVTWPSPRRAWPTIRPEYREREVR